MSSILKALKKLEHEKSGRLPDPLKIDSDILRVSEPSRGITPFFMTLFFLLVFGGGAAVSFFLMKGTKAPNATTVIHPAIRSEAPQSAVPATVANPAPLPAKTAVVQAHVGASGKAADTAAQRPAKVAVSDMPAPAKTRNSKEANVAVSGELAAAAAVPALRVNGIAFQNSAADSLAIVNGVPVSRGSVIEGVTVEEVQKDRVLFHRNREKFEIQLGQSNR